MCDIYNSRNLINVLDPYIVLLHKNINWALRWICWDLTINEAEFLCFNSILKIKTEVCKFKPNNAIPTTNSLRTHSRWLHRADCYKHKH